MKSVKRTYGQYCGLAHALDLLGDRWTLLVVRELLLGSRRYGELLRSLDGIGTNLLARRLRELEAAGIAARDDAGAYVLTEHGRALEEPVVALCRWGLRTIGPPSPERAFEPRWLGLTLQALFRPDAARGVRETWEYRVGGEVFAVHVDDGRAEVRPGVAEAPDVVVTAEPHALLALGAGVLSPEDALATGAVRVLGDRAAFERSVAALGLPA